MKELEGTVQRVDFLCFVSAVQCTLTVFEYFNEGRIMMSINVIMTSLGKLFVVVLLSACFDGVLCEGKTCDVHVPFKCEQNEMCALIGTGPAEGICMCRTGFQLNENGSCTMIPDLEHSTISGSKNKSDTLTDQKYSGATASTITAGVLIPLSVLVVSALMYIAHRYKWLQRLQQFRMRRYDEVHIGQDDDDDDPPLQ